MTPDSWPILAFAAVGYVAGWIAFRKAVLERFEELEETMSIVGRSLPVEAVIIEGADKLDSIQVYWANAAPCKGYVTIGCYGCAWTAYFGAMPVDTIQEFFQRADSDYLINKLGNANTLRAARGTPPTLQRIVEAIKTYLKEAK